MNVKLLEGKNAIRIKEAKTTFGLDGSYMRKPIKILKVTEHKIVAQTKGIFDDKERITILNYDWLDDNWIDYDELMDGISLGNEKENLK